MQELGVQGNNAMLLLRRKVASIGGRRVVPLLDFLDRMLTC